MSASKTSTANWPRSIGAYTPGPWKVVIETRPHLDPSYYVTALDPDSRSGALEVPFHIGLAGGNSRTLLSGRTAANAALVSAAPDLLEALCGLLRVVDLRDGNADAMEAAEAAVIKATGGAP